VKPSARDIVKVGRLIVAGAVASDLAFISVTECHVAQAARSYFHDRSGIAHEFNQQYRSDLLRISRAAFHDMLAYCGERHAVDRCSVVQ
jgi:hypothetical protein